MGETKTAAGRLEPKTKRGLRTRDALLRAAEKCFGEKGFHASSVSDITDEAGMAIGTFYLYFTDKLEIFRAVVDQIQTELRQHLRRSDNDDRLVRERHGLADFLAFARARPRMFRILQESYVVDPDIYFSYFESIAASYARQLKAAQAGKQIADANPDIQAWCLIAISNFLGMRYSHPSKRRANIGVVVDTAADFIAHGLSPNGRAHVQGQSGAGRMPLVSTSQARQRRV